jgi:hypothetical protein
MPSKNIPVFLLFLFVTHSLFSQGNELAFGSGSPQVKNKPILSILNKVSINFSAGYGRTFYRQDYQNSGFVLNPVNSNPGLYLFSLNKLSYGTQIPAVQNWMNRPVSSLITLDENLDKNKMVLADSAKFSYSGSSSSYPLTLSLHYEFLKRLRIGGGLTVEFLRLPVLTPSYGEEIIGKYVPDIRNSVCFRYFVVAGAKAYQWMYWTYYVDLQVGMLKMGNAFQAPAITQRIYYNLGAPIEYEFSEYLKAVIRPSFEFNSNSLTAGSGGASINKQSTSFYLNVGFRYNIPEIPRCPVKANAPAGYDYPSNFTNKSCKIQKKHAHGDLAFRGQPFYKHQNPEIGENYPKLVKYRFFNKRKMSAGY